MVHAKQKRQYTAMVMVVAALVSLTIATDSGAATSTPAPLQRIAPQGAPMAALRWDPRPSTHKVAAPGVSLLSGIRSAVFTVNFIATGTKDAAGTDCYEWPTEARSAFSHAAAIWASLVDSEVPIAIDACWADLGPGILGYAGAGDYVFRNNTLYPVALANALFGSDMNEDDAEINVTYSRKFDWYWGTDGNPPPGTIDFVTVVLHEICHGLGFSGSMHVADGLGYWGFGVVPFPTEYDRHAETGSGRSLLDFDYGSPDLATQLTSNDVFFDGPQTSAANGGAPAKLFAPSTWMPGSSYVHLDEVYNGTEHALMTYALSSGESLHNPGEVALGVLQDIGWRLEQAAHDLELTMTDLSAQNLFPGAPLTYTIGLQNLGPGAAVQVVMSNVLSSHVVSATWSASPSLGDVSPRHDTTFVWELQELEAEGSGTFTVTGQLDPSLTASVPIVNAAQASAQGIDADPSNDRDVIIFGGHLTFLPLAFAAVY